MKTKKERLPLRNSCGEGDELEGIYANTFKVGYNAYEFVLDFGQNFSEKGEEKFHTRIVTNPEHIENLHKILSESIKSIKS